MESTGEKAPGRTKEILDPPNSGPSRCYLVIDCGRGRNDLLRDEAA